MRLRAHRRSLVIWSHSAGPEDWYAAPRHAQVARRTRMRRGVRTAGLLTIMGMMRLARGARPRWRPLLAGTALTAAGLALGNAWSLMFLAGVWAFIYSVLIPDGADAGGSPPPELRRELAGYCTPGQCRDLAATFDRYPDGVTRELRDVLVSQAMTG
jgi:hypothetical protein